MAESRILSKEQRQIIAQWLDKRPWQESNAMMRMGLTQMEGTIRDLLATIEAMEPDAEVGRVFSEFEPKPGHEGVSIEVHYTQFDITTSYRIWTYADGLTHISRRRYTLADAIREYQERED